MCEDIIARIEVSVLIVLASKDLPGVLNEVERAEGISQSVLDRQARRGNGVVRVVMPGESVPMSKSEERHLEADESVLHSSGHVVGTVARYVIWDSSKPYKNGQKEALPVGSEDNALDAQKLGHGAKRLQVLGHADPKHGQSIQADCDAEVVYDGIPQVARIPANISL